MKIKSIQKIKYENPIPVYDVVDVQPNHNFAIIQNDTVVISHNCATMDETNFAKAGVKDINLAKQHMKKLYDTINARISGTFRIGGEVYGKLIAASSKNTDSDFLSDHIETQLNAGNTHLYLVDKPQWEVLPKSMFSDEVFHFTVGDRYKRGFVIPEENEDEAHYQEYINQGYEVIEAPAEFKKNFIADYDISLRDIAGRSVAGALGFITQEAITPNTSTSRYNPFFTDTIEVGTQDNKTIEEFFRLEVVPDRLKHCLLNIHLDLSETGDRTGIGGVWVDGQKTVQDFSGRNVSLPYFREAFSVGIEHPRGDRLSFQKVVNFIFWLRRNGFNIGTISTDQYQSSYMRELLDGEGFKTAKISVDRSEEPYIGLKNILYDQRIELIHNELRDNELIRLQRINGKIDHPANGSKDLSDCLCLSGDTKVYTLDGKNHTIAEMYKNFDSIQYHVLSYDTEAESLVPNLVLKVVDNGKSSDMVRITLDTGESFKCTSDHLILMRDGSYRPASETLNCSLMPFTIFNKVMYQDRDYPYVEIPKISTQDYTTQPLHKLVAEYTYSDEIRQISDEKSPNEWIVVHHKDCNRSNADPSNLQVMTNVDHCKIHAAMNQTAEKRQRLKELADAGIIGIKSFPEDKIKEMHERSKVPSSKFMSAYNKTDKHRQEASKCTKARMHSNLEYWRNRFIESTQSESAKAKRKVTLSSPEQQSRLAAQGASVYRSSKFKETARISKARIVWELVQDYNSDIDSISWVEYNIAIIRLRMSGKLSSKYGVQLNDIALLKSVGVPIIEDTITDEMKHKVAWYKCLSRFVLEYQQTTDQETFTYQNFIDWKYDAIRSNPNHYELHCSPCAYEDLIKIGAPIVNHRVVKIEYVEAEQVYDIVLADIHNFALSSGLFVHNCGACWTLTTEHAVSPPPPSSVAGAIAAVNKPRTSAKNSLPMFNTPYTRR